MATPAVDTIRNRRLNRTPLQNSNASDSLLKILAFLAPACVLMAAICEYGYLSGLGLSYMALPIQMSDLTRAAFHLSTPSLFVLLAGSGFIFFRRHLQNWAPPTTVRVKGLDWGDKLTLFVMAAYLLGWLCFGDDYAQPAVLMPVWAIGIGWIFSEEKALRSTSRWLRIGFLVGPMLFLFSFGHGYSNGKQDLRGNVANAVLTFKGSGASTYESKAVTVLRAYEQGVLVKWNGASLSFIRSAEILRIDYDRKNSFWGGLLRQ